MDAATSPESKNALRAQMRRRLAALASEERAEHSRQIARRIVELPAWRAASCVLLFAPLPTEPDLDLLWRNGALAGKRAAYPRVEGAAMRLYYVRGLDELEFTRWGWMISTSCWCRGWRSTPPAGGSDALADSTTDCSRRAVPRRRGWSAWGSRSSVWNNRCRSPRTMCGWTRSARRRTNSPARLARDYWVMVSPVPVL